MNSVRNYTQQDCERDTAYIRQLNDEDSAVWDESQEPRAPAGTWVVCARYDSGVGETAVDLSDVLREIAKQDPQMIEAALGNRKLAQVEALCEERLAETDYLRGVDEFYKGVAAGERDFAKHILNFLRAK